MGCSSAKPVEGSVDIKLEPKATKVLNIDAFYTEISNQCKEIDALRLTCFSNRDRAIGPSFTKTVQLADEAKRIPEAVHVLFITDAVQNGGQLTPGVDLSNFGQLD